MNAMFKTHFPPLAAQKGRSRTAASKSGVNTCTETYTGRNEFSDIARYVFDKRRELMRRLAK